MSCKPLYSILCSGWLFFSLLFFLFFSFFFSLPYLGLPYCYLCMYFSSLLARFWRWRRGTYPARYRGIIAVCRAPKTADPDEDREAEPGVGASKARRGRGAPWQSFP
ncbi:hypothetical protein LZ31DRAFT_99137 [Colletotrichum somersetense]|nr:hypothetical protein LZ31DRAFT_99137 [Colletotrichum somersetense]